MHFLKGEEPPVAPLEHEGGRSSSEDASTRHVCDICGGRIFVGEQQWLGKLLLSFEEIILVVVDQSRIKPGFKGLGNDIVPLSPCLVKKLSKHLLTCWHT